MKPYLALALVALVAGGCGGTDEDDDAPPPVATDPAAGATEAIPTAPSGQVNITVIANSTPPGAVVTGGGRQLGLTPLQTQVPVPAAAPGEVQTFAFTFQLPGYQVTTVNAPAVNNTINVTASLAPLDQVNTLPTSPTAGAEGAPGRTLNITGTGGGRIFDDHTTTAHAEVDEICMIDRLQVRLRGNHTFYGDLHISVRDPEGNRYSLSRGGRRNPFRTHTIRRAVGREARGRWTLSIADRQRQDTGNLRGFSMSVVCR